MPEQPPVAEGTGGDKERAPPAGEMLRDIPHLIASSSVDGVIVVDDQGVIRVCNQAAEELFARPAKYLIGTQFGFPITAGGVAEVQLRLPGGRQRVVEMRVIAATMQDERLYVAALRDITRRRKGEQELQEALERRSVAVPVAAWELHRPLAAIEGIAHRLQHRDASMTEAERASLIARIIERTTRLRLTLGKLVTAAEIDTARLRPTSEMVPLLDVIAEQLADFEDVAPHIEVTCDPALAVHADRAELSIMLANYLDNAVTYGAPPIQVQAGDRDGWAEIRVTDAGPGVPGAFAPHLFERHTRGPGAEQKAEGTGQGLWIVRTFAQMNDGDAWHEPATPHGASFCLRLPLPGAESAPEAAASP